MYAELHSTILILKMKQISQYKLCTRKSGVGWERGGGNKCVLFGLIQSTQ